MDTFLHDKTRQKYGDIYKIQDIANEKGKWNVIFFFLTETVK